MVEGIRDKEVPVLRPRQVVHAVEAPSLGWPSISLRHISQSATRPAVCSRDHAE